MVEPEEDEGHGMQLASEFAIGVYELAAHIVQPEVHADPEQVIAPDL